MSPYILGFLLVILSVILHAGANSIDSVFANKLFKRLATVVFLSQLIGLVFLLVIAVISPPTVISVKVGAALFICAVVEIFYLFPYYWSFREADTSVVTSLFSLGK